MDTRFEALSPREQLLVLSLYYNASRFTEWAYLASAPDADYVTLYSKGIPASRLPPLALSPELVAQLYSHILATVELFGSIGGKITTRHDSQRFYPQAIHDSFPLLSHFGKRLIIRASPFVSVYHNNIPTYNTFLAQDATLDVLRKLRARIGHFSTSAFDPSSLGVASHQMAHVPVIEVRTTLMDYHDASGGITAVNAKAFSAFCRSGLCVSGSWPTGDTDIDTRPSILPLFSDAAIVFGAHLPTAASSLPWFRMLAELRLPIFLYGKDGVRGEFVNMVVNTDRCHVFQDPEELSTLIPSILNPNSPSEHAC